MNPVVLITGATSGIGKACAEKFASHGYDLVITGRRHARLMEIQTSLEKNQRIRVLPLCFDVRDKDAVFSAINSMPEEWKNVNILINNAGLALGKDSFENALIEDWDNMLDTNVYGLLYVSRAILPFMISRNKGHIINIGSVAGKEVYESGNVYCASKFAVDAISRSMRIDLLKYSIKVTAIHPGAVETEFSLVRFKGDEEKAHAAYNGLVPLTSENIAETIFFTATLPPHVCINELVITCLQQAGGIYFYRK